MSDGVRRWRVWMHPEDGWIVPDDHDRYEGSFEVMPVSGHEALREAAQAVLRSWDAEPWWAKNTAGTCMHIEDLRAVLASADSEADR